MDFQYLNNNFQVAGSAIYIPGWQNERKIPEIPPLPYSNCFVAYLDILGFKDLVYKNEKAKIAEYFYLINYRLRNLKRIELKENIKSIIISDSVILSLEIKESIEERLIDFRQLCIAVRDIQLNLATHNLLLRGGISYGEAHMENNNIVGKAYLNSYLLGDKKAIFPRVIIDPTIVKELLPNQKSQDFIDTINRKKDKNKSIEKNVLFDWGSLYQNTSLFTRDVAFFIDYLYACVSNKDQLEKIIVTIDKNIYSDQNIYLKYRWFVDYLKVCCEKFKRKNKNLSTDLERLYQVIERY